MNVDAARSVVTSVFAAAVATAGYASTQIDWSAFNTEFTDPAPAVAVPAGGQLVFRPLFYMVPGAARPMALGESAPSERLAQFRVDVFGPSGMAEKEITAGASRVTHAVVTGVAAPPAPRRPSLDSSGLVTLYWGDLADPEYVGNVPPFSQYQVTIDVRVHDRS